MTVKTRERTEVEVLNVTGEALSVRPSAPMARVPAAPLASPYARYVGRQVFVEVFGGSKYTGTVLSAGDGYIELDTAVIRTAGILVLSDTLLPLYSAALVKR